MINIKLIEHIFKAASISRWNDYPRMANLVELDKQAHKSSSHILSLKWKKMWI